MVVRAIQSEWIFLHNGTKNTGDMFAGVENTLLEMFFLSYYSESKKSLTHRMNSNYDSIQEIRTGPPEYCDTREQKYLSLKYASTKLI